MNKLLKLFVVLLISYNTFSQTSLDGLKLKSNEPYYLYKSGPSIAISELNKHEGKKCIGWGKGWGSSSQATQWMEIFKETSAENQDLATYSIVNKWVDNMCQDDDFDGSDGFFGDFVFPGFNYGNATGDSDHNNYESNSINDCKWTINTGHTGTLEMNRVFANFVIENDDDDFRQFWITRYHSNYEELSSHTFKIVNPIELDDNFEFSYCKNDAPISLIPFVNNDDLVPGAILTIKIDGEVKNILDPSILSTSSIHSIDISMAYDNGVFSRSYSFEIKESDVVEISPISPDNEICINTGLYNLNASPSGGSWSLVDGNNSAFSNGQINSDVINAIDDYTIEYNYTNIFGCKTSKEVIITINALPDISSVISSEEYCENEDEVDLSLLELNLLESGVSSWTDLEDLGTVSYKEEKYTFNPSYAKLDLNLLRYNFTSDITGCSTTGIKALTIHEKPFVSGGEDNSFCADESPFNPNFTSPSGGNWSGEGFSSNRFFPESMTTNIVTGTYMYTDNNGCSNTDNVLFIRNSLPEVSHNTLEECSTSGAITLSGGSPTGGTYTGSNVSVGIFDINSVNSGSVNSINYEVTDDNGCINDVDFNLFILDDVIVDAGPDIKSCVGDIVELTGMNPSNGGEWQQTYVLGDGQIQTSELSVGSYTLDYTVSSSLGCTGTDSRVLEVFALPSVNILASSRNICVNNDPVLLDFGIPSNGTWSGQGIEFSDNSYFFNPSTSIENFSNSITYTYTDNNGCSNSKNISYFTREIPDPTVVRSISKCINDQSFDLSDFVFAESTTNRLIYESPFVNGSFFNMNNIKTGEHDVTIKEENVFGCIETVSTIVNIYQLPSINAGSDTSFCENIGKVSIGDYEPSNAIWSTNNVLNNNLLDINKISGNSTTLTLNYTDNNGCSNTDDIIITKNKKTDVTANLSEEVCENSEPIVFSSGLPLGGNYFGNGLIDNVFYPSVVGSGINTINYTFSNSDGCFDTAQISVIVHKPTTSYAGDDTLICNSSSDVDLSLYSTSFPNGLGSNWSMTPTVGILENILRPDLLNSGEYILYKNYVDANRCSTLDSLILTVESGLDVPVLSGDNNLCFGDTFLLSASVPNEDIDTRFNWFYQGVDSIIFTGKDFEIIPNTDVVLFVEAENGFGCPSLRTIHEIDIERPNGEITIENDTIDFGSLNQITLKNSEDVELSKWLFNKKSISFEPNPYHYFYTEGLNSISVLLTSSLGCTLEISNDSLVYVRNNDFPINTSSGNSSNSSNNYSNELIYLYPTYLTENEIVNIEYINSSPSNYELHIIDLNGNILKSNRSVSKINLSDYPSGLYIVKLISLIDGEIKNFKINK